MLFLYVFGNNLNEKLGNMGYLCFYLTGGVLAGCGQILVSNAPTLGASGAISAVTGLFLVLLPRTNIRVFVYLFVYVDVWIIPSLYFIIFSVLKDFFEPLIWGAGNTAHAAHLSGNAAGFLIGLLLLLTRLVQRDHYDLLATLDRWRRRKQYESLVAGGYDPFRPTSRVAKKYENGKDAAAEAADPRILQWRETISQAVRSHDLPAAVVKYQELRALDPTQVMPPSEQLDIANQLMSEGRHDAAASAYEDYLRVYSTSHQHDQIVMILGVIYARYLGKPQRAKELFEGLLPRLHDAKQVQWVRDELSQLSPPPSPVPPPPKPRIV